MTARLDGAVPWAGFSTSPVTRTTSSSSVASTVATPYMWATAGSTSSSAITDAPALRLHLDHAREQHIALVDDVVTEQHRERLVADVHPRAQHGVAEPARIALAHVVHLGEVGRVVDLLEPSGVALRLEGRLELADAIEVVLERVLVAARDHEHVGQTGRDRLLDDVLDRRLVDDRKHLLRHRLRGRQEASAEACRGDDCFGDAKGHGTQAIGGHCDEMTVPE